MKNINYEVADLYGRVPKKDKHRWVINTDEYWKKDEHRRVLEKRDIDTYSYIWFFATFPIFFGELSHDFKYFREVILHWKREFLNCVNLWIKFWLFGHELMLESIEKTSIEITM